MPLTYENVGSKKPAKINTYMLARAELLITLCYEIPCIRFNFTVHTMLVINQERSKG